MHTRVAEGGRLMGRRLVHSWGRWAVRLLLALAMTANLGWTALGHGERAQESFLKGKTVAWFDVQFSSDEVDQGEAMTITGRFKILEIWPQTLQEPRMAYVSIAAPGPKFVLKERVINGKVAPGSIHVKKGGVYEFKLTIVGRTPGTWHVHPVVAIQGSGSLIGPGKYIRVNPVPGGFSNLVTLLNGRTVDLEKYAFPWVLGVSIVGFLIGVWWMLFWTVKHRTITRLPITSQLPLSDDGASIGLTTPMDHRMVNLLAGLTVVLLVVAWGYSAQAFPQTIPQQVVRFEPPELRDDTPKFVEAQALGAEFNPLTDTLTLDLEVTNVGQNPVRFVDYIVGQWRWVNSALAGPQDQHVAEVGNDTIAPGETAKLRLVMQDAAWEVEGLVPMGESSMSMGGLVTFRDSLGRVNRITTEAKLFMPIVTQFY